MSKTMIRMAALCVVLLIGMGSDIVAQNLLYGPECVAFDSVRNRYLVSCYKSGQIVEIDSNGVQSYWGLQQSQYLGCLIEGNTYYASAASVIIGYDLETGDPNTFWQLPLDDGDWLDGLAADSSGYIYVIVPRSGKIFKINILSSTKIELVSGGLPMYPQELYFDARHNRLLVASWAYHAPIVAVDVETGEITTLVESTIGYGDGITMDPYGNVYVASEKYHVITMYDSSFTNPEVTIASSGLNGPSALEYIWRDHILAVPNHENDEMLYYSMVDSDGDGAFDFMDNCSSTPNSDQNDVDADGLGDLCDNCPDVANTDQVDEDQNEIGDACEGCCGEFSGGQSGNADCDIEGRRNLADITRLIDRIYVSKAELCCEENGNTDGDTESKINLSDITRLIDHVYVSKLETSPCS